MEKFTVKIQKETWEYEICAYPYSGDAEKYIKATRFHKGKFVQEMSVDLSCVHPEFFEVQAEREKRRAVVFASGKTGKSE